MKPVQLDKKIAIGSSLVFALTLSACGGGGGGVSSTPPPPVFAPVTPTPPPAPPPPPPPPPPPTTNFATAEYNRSDGPAFHNAITAYQAGATGSGVIVGVIDSGIDATSHEFTGRIHAQSGDVTGTGRGLADEDGHGTEVTRVIAAAKDDRDIHGIAFNATILALRADSPGSCTTPEPGNDEASCSFSDTAIANGVNRATDNGARVINISLGGAGGASLSLRNAISRATQAGIIVVVSAGNEGDETTPEYDPLNPSPFAQALVANGNGLVIISTSVDDQGVISDFSNRAGGSASTTLSALGEGICCVYKNDTIYRFTENGVNLVQVFNGTSFSAPQITGAAALLAQAFPNLTGQQIVNLLLTSARDAGATGTDSVYGRGILDIARAFAPAGATSLAGTTKQVELNGNAGTISGAMGDAGIAIEPVTAVILDSYGRAYDIDLTHGLASSAPQLRLSPALAHQGRSVSAGIGATQIAFSIGSTRGGDTAISPLALSNSDRQKARILAGRVSSTIAKDLRFSLGIRQAAASQVAALQGVTGGAFLTTSDARFETGFERRPGSSVAIRRGIGDFGITGSAETGSAQLYERADVEYIRGGNHRYRYSALGLSLDRQFGPAKLTLGANWMQERDTVLGARFAGFFDQNGARSLFLDASGSVALGSNWSAGASWRQGWTHANTSSIIASESLLKSNAFSFDVTRASAFAPGDRLALRISQPLRVTGGGLALNVPVAYDYASLSSTFGIRRFNLAPQGQEIASEMAWIMPLDGGYFSTNLFWRQDPGHFENVPDDLGVAFRLQFGF